MIKLQLLLRHAAAEPGLDAGLRDTLAALGMHVTGCGRATVSVQIAPDDFALLFGAQADTADLAVPPGLANAVSLITCAPQHWVRPHTPKAKHAAI